MPSPRTPAAPGSPHPTATAGSPAAPTGLLPAGTAMGPLGLRARDVAATVAFYRDALGLRELRRSPDATLLGGPEPLLAVEPAGAAPADARGAGLYHAALRYAHPAALAAALRRVRERAPGSCLGGSDHGVSEAFYFVDPEGNGLELYVDRPRERWSWAGGRVRMRAARSDPGAFVARHAGPYGDADAGASVGHVHLRVGDLAVAQGFYVDTVGFEVTAEVDGALFVAVGGYHHHVGLNTWQSAGAGRRRPGEPGLAWFTVTVPGAGDVAAVSRRLDAAAVGWRATPAGVLTADPWGNELAVVAGS